MGLLDDPVAGPSVDAEGNPVDSGQEMNFSLSKGVEGTQMSYSLTPPAEPVEEPQGMLDWYTDPLSDPTNDNA